MIAFDDFADLQDTPEFRGLDLVRLDRELIALALEDVDDISSSRKGKRRADAGPSDEELAFALFVQELEDHEIAYSLASALGTDEQVIVELERLEAEARQDRALAESLARGEPLPKSALTPPIQSGFSTPSTIIETPASVQSFQSSRRASFVGSPLGFRNAFSSSSTTLLDRAVDNNPHREAIYATQVTREPKTVYNLPKASETQAETAALIAELERQEEEARKDRALAMSMSMSPMSPLEEFLEMMQQSPQRVPSPGPSNAMWSVLQSLPVMPAKVASPQASIRAAVAGPSHGYGQLFGVSPTPRFNRGVEEQPNSSTNVECVACTVSIPRGARSLKAPCSHIYDAGCIADLFRTSLTDESRFPPRCCQQEIPFREARPLLPTILATQFEIKSVELRTKRRVYCSDPSCSKFLGAQTNNPGTIICTTCGRSTCSGCSGPLHKPGDLTCAQRLDGRAITDIALENGWQRCPSCRRMVERLEGCPHMTCICRTQFCYSCGALWGTCRCH